MCKNLPDVAGVDSLRTSDLRRRWEHKKLGTVRDKERPLVKVQSHWLWKL